MQGAAETLHVDADGSGDYATIQAAVDAATDGDVVELGDGVFVGDGNRDVDYLGKSIAIRSASGNADACVIDCQASENDWHRGFVFQSSETPASLLANITVRGGLMTGPAAGAWNVGGAVLCFPASPTLLGCVFESNEAIEGGALHASDGAARIDGCLFAGNRARTGGGASVAFSFGGPYQVIASTFAGNSASNAGGGLYVGNFADVQMSRSVVWGNCASSGGDDLLIDLFGFVYATCSLIPSTFGGEGELETDPFTLFKDPLFCDPADCEEAPTTAGVYTVALNSPATPENSACGQQIGALPVGCGATPARVVSWSQLKKRFGPDSGR
jgi:hypothetical protein